MSNKKFPFPRDRRREKLYCAESDFHDDGHTGILFMNQESMQQYTDTLCRQIDVAPIRVLWSKRRSKLSVADPPGRTINICNDPFHHTERALLHEIAHVVCGFYDGGHGAEFQRTSLQLVAFCMGRGPALELAEAYETWGVLDPDDSAA